MSRRCRRPFLSCASSSLSLAGEHGYIRFIRSSDGRLWIKLAEEGVFKDVERTQAGHRRIPATEVDRVHGDMRSTRRAALHRIEALAPDLRQRELDAARTAPKRRWVKTAG